MPCAMMRDETSLLPPAAAVTMRMDLLDRLSERHAGPKARNPIEINPHEMRVVHDSSSR